jgi:hypothetical protein
VSPSWAKFTNVHFGLYVGPLYDVCSATWRDVDRGSWSGTIRLTPFPPYAPLNFDSSSLYVDCSVGLLMVPRAFGSTGV